ncbi:hypothetical protein A2721_00100 [Candidatus Gottesmanbacteria bacterium RIFCSPHIGHO2_01_FULL_47_48]|uniref:Uncharacterized protein n=1 Tax=Candidatus Gottesmanbacteria bacterium RIFCSPHIGHO2_01_FULL_47_48 TaxID=1798381 RepID=A0A1F6A3H1_9BACT|nr:MAG: hypothetical protein A2721_00100 [Candidatus Gottesmanbacteria bacterium RIFCSPHIGHO2_01_FULL_47_48]
MKKSSLFLIGGFSVLVVLALVLVAAVMRVGNPADFFLRPQAAVSCGRSSPAEVWNCYQKGIDGAGRGNCSWCWAQYTGGGTGGTGGGSCYDNCFAKTGNGSGCQVVCASASSCFNQCVSDGVEAKSCIVPCVNGTYQSQTNSQTNQNVAGAKCQGNVDAPAKCFDCKKDAGTSSEVNILDFACLAKYYGKNVGL